MSHTREWRGVVEDDTFWTITDPRVSVANLLLRGIPPTGGLKWRMCPLKKVLPHLWCTCERVVKGRTLARSSSKGARPYIWRLMVLSLPTWPSTGPLLHASDTAASTALKS